MDATKVRYVSGDVVPTQGKVKLRIEAEDYAAAQDFLIAVDDIQPFVTLLLILGGRAARLHGLGSPAAQEPIVPLPVDTIAIAETVTGDALFQIEIGGTSLAFVVPAHAIADLGQTLLALSASPAAGSA